MNIAALLHQQALSPPQTPAIIDWRWRGDRITTYAELELAASRGVTLLARGRMLEC